VGRFSVRRDQPHAPQGRSNRARPGPDAASQNETEELRKQVALAEQRLEILAGHEQRMAGRIKDLRARLLEAHAQMIRRDDEIRKTFGDAIYLRNALLIERDVLIGQRDALVAERTSLVAERDALLEERHALARSLKSAEFRLNLLRSSPLGLAYRAFRKLVTRRGCPPP
jgi:hypothetical protein